MARYTQDSVERVKAAVDMVDLVGAHSELRRQGSRHVGLCPFHDERTPSFSVSPELGLYYCFGCEAGGDAIKFVVETEGLDFTEAVEWLADRYGVELKKEREDPREEERRRRHGRLLQLLDKAASFYARFLWESEEAGRARAYLEGRGLGEEILRAFRIGYAPSAWDRLLRGARSDGFTEEELAAAGLGQRGRQGGFHDSFRARITFPLADARGRVLGFGARAVRDEQRPKYLNTRETELYHKGRQLFGIDRARAAAAKVGRIVVVEGYTDVLALHQAGVTESVAVMGTALTPEQIAELGRAAPSIHLALDADQSGQEAMLRAARAAETRGVELRVVELPRGRDPAELIAEEGAEGFATLLGRSATVPEFAVRRLLAEADLEDAAGRDRALEELRPLIAAVPARTATRDALVSEVSDRLDIPPDYVATALEAAPAAAPRAAGANGGGERVGNGPGAPATPGPPSPTDVLERRERDFLAMCVSRPEPGRTYLERLSDDHLTGGRLRRARAHLAEHPDDPRSGLPDDDPTLAALVGEILMRAEERPASERDLRLGFLQLERLRLERAERRAHQAKRFEELRGLWAEREQIRSELEAVLGEAG